MSNWKQRIGPRLAARLALVMFCLAFIAGTAHAQAKHVEWVVGYGAGGGSDIVTRTVEGKKIKVIGAASAKRLTLLPEVPTFAEQGLKGFEGYAWQGLVVPTGTPPEIIVTFSKALQDALPPTPVKARAQAPEVEPMPDTGAQMASFVRAEREKWGAVINQVGVKLD